jgi:hypothetical protein
MASSDNMSTADILSRGFQTLRLLTIIFGVPIVVLLGLIGWKVVIEHIPKGITSPTPPPPSSPIVVRGGSEWIDSDIGWAAVGNGSSANLSYYTLVNTHQRLNLYLLNASPTNGQPLSPNPLQLNDQWKVTLTFSDNRGDPQHSITICGNSSCSPYLPPSPLLPQVVATADADGRWTPSPLKNSDNEIVKNGTIQYMAQHCHGQPVSGDSTCNYISRITIDPESLTNPSSPLDYTCPDANSDKKIYCKLGIGP